MFKLLITFLILTGSLSVHSATKPIIQDTHLEPMEDRAGPEANFATLVSKPLFELVAGADKNKKLTEQEENMIKIISHDFNTNDDEIGFKRVILTLYALRGRSYEIDGKSIRSILEQSMSKLLIGGEDDLYYLDFKKTSKNLGLPEDSDLKAIIEKILDELVGSLSLKSTPLALNGNEGCELKFKTSKKLKKITLFLNPDYSVSDRMHLQIKNGTKIKIMGVTNKSDINKIVKEAEKVGMQKLDFVSEDFRNNLPGFINFYDPASESEDSLDSLPIITTEIEKVVVNIPIAGGLVSVKTDKQKITLFPGFESIVYGGYENRIPSLIEVPVKPGGVAFPLRVFAPKMKTSF